MKTILLILSLTSSSWAGGGYLSSMITDPLAVKRDGDTMTGNLDITSSGFSVGGSTIVVANGTVAIGKTPTTAIVLDVYDGATRNGVNIAAGGVNGTYYPLVAKNSGGTKGMWLRDNGNLGINTNSPTAQLHIVSDKAPSAYAVNISSQDASLMFGITGTGATSGGALCLNSSKVLSKCTSVVDVSGNCTCP